MASSVRRRQLLWLNGLQGRSVTYATGLAVTVGVTAAILEVSGGFDRVGEALWPVLGLALVAAAAERGRVRLSPRHEESISLLPTLYAAVLAGPGAGMIVGAASFLLEVRGPRTKWMVYSSTRALSGGAAGATAVALADAMPGGMAETILVVGGAAVVIEVLDLLFVTITGYVRKVHPDGLLSIARERLPLALQAVPFAVSVITMLLLAHTKLSAWTLPLFFIPALTAHRLFVMYQAKSALASELGAANSRLEGASLALASSLVAALDARDHYTAGHSAAVALHARKIAAELGLDARAQEMAHQCGLVHDIGKIGLSSSLLEKCGRLEVDERTALQAHPTIGAEILAKGDVPEDMLEAVLYHHERFDGSGYPAGLRGEEIPLLARVLAVADAFDAMVSDRPYRAAMPFTRALRELVGGAGTQFDSSVVAAFLRSVDVEVPIGLQASWRCDQSRSCQKQGSGELTPSAA